MTVQKEDHPIARLTVDLSAHPMALQQVLDWLRDTADYLQANQTKASKHFRARLFCEKIWRGK